MLSLRSFDSEEGVDTSGNGYDEEEASCAKGEYEDDKEDNEPVLIDNDDAVFCELFNDGLELLSVEDIGNAFFTTLLMRFITVTADMAAWI
uniref:Ovule protein n=1 Tax=Parastrongyloides trichosuri TaxID=131310 RepID=A0A0N5A3R1_PARTI